MLSTSQDSPWWQRARVLAALPPLLLMLVASGHLLLVETQRLSPWKGGGFGMFSTVDSPSGRFTRLYLLNHDGADAARFPTQSPGFLPLVRTLERECRTLPTQDKLQAYAREVLRQRFRIYDAAKPSSELSRREPAPDEQPLLDADADSVSSEPRGTSALHLPVPVMLAKGDPRIPTGDSGVEADFKGVEVEVWTTSFDAMKHEVVAWKLRSARVFR